MVFGSSATDAYLEEGVKAMKKVLNNGDGQLLRREFKTTAERNAYMLGLEDMNGWEDWADISAGDLEKHKDIFSKLLKN